MALAGHRVDQEERKVCKRADASSDFEEPNASRSENKAEFVLEFTVAERANAELAPCREKSLEGHAFSAGVNSDDSLYIDPGAHK